jgi:hypothetical protein
MHVLTIILEPMVLLYEPDALKGASPVRGGAVGNALSYETTRKAFGMSREQNSNALAAYSTPVKGQG